MSVLAIGIYALDLFMIGTRLPTPGESVNCESYAEAHGGKAANQAVAAARLGASTALVAKLGRDVRGQDALSMLKEEDVDVTHISTDEHLRTGVGFIILDRQGSQLIATYPGAGGGLSISDVERARSNLKSASVLLLQGEISAEVSLAAARMTGDQTTVIMDPSPAETFLGLGCLEDVDILTPNEQEAAIIANNPDPDSAAISEATGIQTIILTRGKGGVEIFDHGRTHLVTATPVEVVDTTGAGDAFNGALAAGLTRGLSLIAAVEHASRCAAICVSRPYCIPSFATLEDISW